MQLVPKPRGFETRIKEKGKDERRDPPPVQMLVLPWMDCVPLSKIPDCSGGQGHSLLCKAASLSLVGGCKSSPTPGFLRAAVDTASLCGGDSIKSLYD